MPLLSWSPNAWGMRVFTNTSGIKLSSKWNYPANFITFKRLFSMVEEVYVMVFVRGAYKFIFGDNAEYVWAGNTSALLIIEKQLYVSVRYSIMNSNFSSLSEIQLIKKKI